ncbi:aromatic amino acid transporter [Candidatus Profftia sp. (ex Adelges kitamiensis)]|uniref:aromatic amino acid transporter n=1 Tax=Candidatus Profftia sp. (ex Adelges kitamiensis) TaxID=2864218 RepID=UPI001CE273C3|nr:aromatic amino acid transporter [Candidatus Profftia sp. (ex Adelges kitamiensis)]
MAIKNNNLTKTKHQPSVLGGAMIIIGTAIGGVGMFSMPVVTAGIWFTGSICLLIYTWFCMYISGLMILEANLNYPTGSSFYTIVGDLLGKKWNFLNGISIAFVLYLLIYVYILTSGSSIMIYTLGLDLSTTEQTTASLLFTILIAIIVWLSTSAVDRLNTILISGMMITFFLFTFDMFTHVNTSVLFNSNDIKARYLPYALASLPYLLTSFGYHGNVPSLVRYYQKDTKSIVLSLFIGTFITLIIYIFWQYVIQGNITRVKFQKIIIEGGNIKNILKQISIMTSSSIINQLLNVFSSMALTSSFLGVSLGLFDFISDFCKFTDNVTGRTKSTLITFIPPTIGALIFPNNFLDAIGFAGLSATIWTVITPAMLAYASRKRFPNANYRAPGGFIMILFIITFGLINTIAYILSVCKLLPVYS